jgi:hypothetical protein
MLHPGVGHQAGADPHPPKSLSHYRLPIIFNTPFLGAQVKQNNPTKNEFAFGEYLTRREWGLFAFAHPHFREDQALELNVCCINNKCPKEFDPIPNQAVQNSPAPNDFSGPAGHPRSGFQRFNSLLQQRPFLSGPQSASESTAHNALDVQLVVGR